MQAEETEGEEEEEEKRANNLPELAERRFNLGGDWGRIEKNDGDEGDASG